MFDVVAVIAVVSGVAVTVDVTTYVVAAVAVVVGVVIFLLLPFSLMVLLVPVSLLVLLQFLMMLMLLMSMSMMLLLFAFIPSLWWMIFVNKWCADGNWECKTRKVSWRKSRKVLISTGQKAGDEAFQAAQLSMIRRLKDALNKYCTGVDCLCIDC